MTFLTWFGWILLVTGTSAISLLLRSPSPEELPPELASRPMPLLADLVAAIERLAAHPARANRPLSCLTPQGWPLSVRMRGRAREKDQRLDFHLGPVPWIPPDLAVLPRGHWSPTPSQLRDAAPTGLPGLDEVAWTLGLPAHVLGLLYGEEVERIPRAVVEQELVLQNQCLSLSIPPPKDGPELEATIRQLLALAEALVARPETLALPLALRASEDTDGERRLQCLAALRELPPAVRRTSEVQAALDRAARHPDPEIRLEAAAMLRTGGNAILRGLALDSATPGPIGARAVGYLASRLSPAELLDSLRPCLDGRSGEAAARFLETFPSQGTSIPEDALRRLLQGSDAAVLAAAAGVAARQASLGSEPAILRLLRRPEPPVVLAAIQALHVIGTAPAVAPLESVAADRELSSELRAAARETASRIRIRYPEVQGQVTLAALPAQAGAVTLAEIPAEAGAVTLAEIPAETGGATLADDASPETSEAESPEPPPARPGADEPPASSQAETLEPAETETPVHPRAPGRATTGDS